MKKLSTILIVLFFACTVFAETDEAKADSTEKSPWETSMLTGLNISQIALSNWAEGGENSLTWTVYLNWDADYTSEKWKFSNEFKVKYGRTKLGDQEFRINDNEIYNESVLAYRLGWEVSPFFSNTFRSVVDRGYDYKVDPKVETSNFFDPAYITQSVGFTYDKLTNFKTRLGIAIQESFADKHADLYTDDEETSEIETFKLETGIESVSSANYTLDDNLLLKSKLRLFGTFEEIERWDVRWDNTIVAKINSHLNVNLSVLVIYEEKVLPKTQLKEALQIGFTYKLF